MSQGFSKVPGLHISGSGCLLSQCLLPSSAHANSSVLALALQIHWNLQPSCSEFSKCPAQPPETGLCSFIRRVLSGSSQRQHTWQDSVAPIATKFGLGAILETEAAPASDLVSARPSFLTDTAGKPEGQTTSLRCRPRAFSPPETVSYQGYFGLYESVPTLADRKRWMTISSGSDMFVAMQSMGRSIRKVLRVGQR